MVEHKLTIDEKARNTHGPMHIFKYTTENLGIIFVIYIFIQFNKDLFIYLGTALISKYFPPIEENHAEKIAINREDIAIDINYLVKGLCPGLQMDVYHIGFPSLHLIPITVSKINILNEYY